MNPPDDPDDEIDELLKLVEEVLEGRQRVRKKLEEYALPLRSPSRQLIRLDRHIREIELRELRPEDVGRILNDWGA